jgi:hypothetical protein
MTALAVSASALGLKKCPLGENRRFGHPALENRVEDDILKPVLLRGL